MDAFIKDLREKSKILGEDNLIFVTVGKMYGFDRLIRHMDNIARNIQDDVIMQIGETKYLPKNAEFFDYRPYEEVRKLYKNSRIIICHAGIGSILMALHCCKPIIVVPRMKKFNEHIDDHQMEIARELDAERLASAVYNIDDLEHIIATIRDERRNFNGKNMLASNLKRYLAELEQSSNHLG